MRRGGLLRGRGPRLSALFTDDVEDVLKTDGRGAPERSRWEWSFEMSFEQCLTQRMTRRARRALIPSSNTSSAR